MPKESVIVNGRGGIPDAAMLVGALILSWIYLVSLGGSFILSLGAVISWILFPLFLIWFFTEISQKVFFDDLIFWTSLAVGCSLIGEAGFSPLLISPESNRLN